MCRNSFRRFVHLGAVILFLQLCRADDDFFARGVDFVKQNPPLEPALLDKLLNTGTSNYSTAMYPRFNKAEPTIVNASIFVKNLGSISESSLNYEAELYLSLGWRDDRLNFKEHNWTTEGYFQLVNTFCPKNRIWIPPVFFSNSKSAIHPDVIKDNSMTFILSTGEVVYRTRVILTTSCSMNLKRFPFDEQQCTLEMSIFGYYDNQVRLQWSVPSAMLRVQNAEFLPPVEINSDIKWLKFSLMNNFSDVDDRKHVVVLNNASDDWQAVCSNYSSCLLIKFDLARQYNFYLIDTFLPCILIVMLSLISLWIDMDEVPARITLCVITLLTLQQTNTNVRSKLPEVSYTKAIDVWLLGCETTIFIVLIEFVCVHAISFGEIGFKEKLLKPGASASSQLQLEKEREKAERKGTAGNTPFYKKAFFWKKHGDDKNKMLAAGSENDVSINEEQLKQQQKHHVYGEHDYVNRIMARANEHDFVGEGLYLHFEPRKIEARRIDAVCRFIIPLCFFFFLGAFFIAYLYLGAQKE